MQKELETKSLLADELVGKYIFFDQFGLGIRQPLESGSVILEDDKKVSATSLLIPSRENKESFDHFPSNPTVADIKRLLKKGAFRIKKSTTNRYNWGYGEPTPTKANTETVKIKSITVRIHVDRFNGKDSYGNPSYVSWSYDLDIEKDSEIDEITCIVLGEVAVPIQVNIETLKEGDEIFVRDKGKATVTKLYGYPKPNSYFCEVTLFDGEKVNISIEKTDFLYYLPYEEHKEEFDVLEENKNELLLSPVMTGTRANGGSLTYFWREVPEAARYIVVVYAIATVYNKPRLYHLSSVELDRNTHFVVLPKISGDIAVKVIAEDRAGNRIAVSRATKRENNR